MIDLPIAIDVLPMPANVRRYLAEAERRIVEFQQSAKIPGFVPSDYERVYTVLRAIGDRSLAAGERFCEWGSGFGVVAGLAAMLGFEAWGIEIELELVEAAQQLAADFELPIEFVHGSFIPHGGEELMDRNVGFSWLVPNAGSAYEEIELDVDDFDVVFAYPWPDEAQATVDLFERFAADGSIHITFHGGDDIRARRKMSVQPRRRTR